VDRVCNLAESMSLEKCGLPDKPLLILDIMKSWKAMTCWTTDFFKTRYGAAQVIVDRTYNSIDSRTLSLAEYMDYLETATEKDPYYMRGITIEDNFPEILDDYTVPEYFKSWHLRLPRSNRPKWGFFYIGPANSGSKMHLDAWMSSSWNAVISG